MEGADLKEIAKKLAGWKKKTETPRTVIVTYGAKPVIVAQMNPGAEEITVTEFPLEQLTKE